MITVIVTTHCPNRGRLVHINYSLRSLISTLPDESQIVVVDNGAYEGLQSQNGSYASRTFFREFSANIVRGIEVVYLPQRRNLGMGLAKNVGIKHAKHKHIVFTDNDIFYVPGWAEQAVQMASNAVERGDKPAVAILRPFKRSYINCVYDDLSFSVSWCSPGIMLFRSEDYGDYQWSSNPKIRVPGRPFLNDLKADGFKLLAPRAPKATHVGRRDSTWLYA